MPTVSETKTVTVTENVLVAKDCNGAALRVGDKVTITFEVRGMQEVLHEQTAEHVKDQLALACVLPNGYKLHMGMFDSDMVEKVS